jgi:hypothetical protein
VSQPVAEHAAALSAEPLAHLAARTWFEAARIGLDIAFDITLNTWHYTLSLARTAEFAAERTLDIQRRLIRGILRD